MNPTGQIKTPLETEVTDRQSGSEYRFGRNAEYKLIVARTLEERKRAWRLVYRSYLDKGYAQPDPDELWYGVYDALMQTTTFLVSRNGRDVATLTIVFDSALGLPADKLYCDELDVLRRNGRRLCEIISLVSEESDRKQCIEVLKHMFKPAYLMACKLVDATDFIITVNPHHSSYYERKMLFRRHGDIKFYDKVNGAPAVLLILDLEEAPGRYIEHYGLETGSFVHHFLDARTVSEAVWFLAENIGRRGRDELLAFFRRKKPSYFAVIDHEGAVRDTFRGAHSEDAAPACAQACPPDAERMMASGMA
ncbi:MAG: hypothetical protein C0404_02330 [Verrucomicrobia bacterium]|nr:hypothetical protein [Verrucomicrobiota bacterium]